MYSLDQRLQQRWTDGSLRQLVIPSNGSDFFSNDYLGLARNETLHYLVQSTVASEPALLAGSTGSRLISGHSLEAHATESFLTHTHHVESALLFPSGYIANITLFSCLPQRGDTIIVDEYIHRSVHDGCMMSKATKWKFRHNNLEDLEAKLKRAKGQCYVAVESLYSMEGDFASLIEITQLTHKYSACLIVDEAHAFGVFGYGFVHQLGLQNVVFATLVTYGKAMGAHGAVVLCQDIVKSYLINFGSPFIYSTAPSDLTWRQIRMGYEFIDCNPLLSKNLQEKIQLFRKQELQTISAVNSPIQAINIADNQQLLHLKNLLFESGLQTYAIFSPTVKVGEERLRICLHSFNKDEDIQLLTYLLKENLPLLNG